MNFHHVDHSGANRKYYLAVLNYIKEHSRYGINMSQSSLSEFINEGVPSETDVLSYQTFPDEFNRKKFNPSVVSKSDFLFHKFTGRKIFFDAHDSGDTDSFSRMASSPVLPRVKCFPSKRFLQEYPVILISTVSTNPGSIADEQQRDIMISCKFGEKARGFYGHTIRESVRRYLKEDFAKWTNFKWVPDKDKYFQELKRTKIVVGAPGWGAHNQSYWGALRCGALLFAHCSLNDIKLFPHSDLIDGDDFVSYDLYNFKNKLYRILHNPDEIERIRNNGRKKFEQGLDYKKSADQLVKHLKGE